MTRNKKFRIGHYMPQYGTSTGTGQVLEKLCHLFKNHLEIDLIIFKHGQRYEVNKTGNLTVVSFAPNKIRIFPPIAVLKVLWGDDYALDSLGIHQPFNPKNWFIKLFSKTAIHYYPHGCFNPRSLNRPSKKLKKQIYYALFEKSIISASQKIICATHNEEIYLKELGFDNTVVAHFPFQIPKFEAEKISKFRNENGFSTSDFLIVFVGRYDIYTKGLDILIKSIKKVNGINSSIKCILIGYNDKKPRELDGLIIVNEAENCVFNLGKMYGKSKYEALVSSDIYVQPSRFESFGVSILEAMSLKIPCLLSDGCDISNRVNHSNGCYIFNGTVDSLSDCINKVYNNPQERGIVANNGYKWVMENLISEVLLRKWEKVYDVI